MAKKPFIPQSPYLRFNATGIEKQVLVLKKVESEAEEARTPTGRIYFKPGPDAVYRFDRIAVSEVTGDMELQTLCFYVRRGRAKGVDLTEEEKELVKERLADE